MLKPRNLANGQEQHEAFKTATRKTAIQYDYRHTDGQLFSCVKPTLEACRQAKENWISKKEETKGICSVKDLAVGCRNCTSNSKHICEQADANRFIEIPVYSEERNENGMYDLIGYRKEYVD